MVQKKFNELERKVHVRNHGLKSRDMQRALFNGIEQLGGSFATTAAKKSHVRDFVSYMKKNGIYILNKITQSDMKSWGESLKQKVESSEIKASTAQDKISAINTILSYARRDNKLHIRAVADINIPKRSYVAKQDKSSTIADLNALKGNIDDRLFVLTRMQREFGLRFKESCLIDAKRTLIQAEKHGVINIERGTKGGRARAIHITSDRQINILKLAAELQGTDRSMIPSHISFAQYQNRSYKSIANVSNGFHQHRHAYSNQRYYDLTGVNSPVKAKVKHGYQHHKYMADQLNISLLAAKIIDKKARLQIAQELGHGRISITNNYLG